MIVYRRKKYLMLYVLQNSWFLAPKVCAWSQLNRRGTLLFEINRCIKFMAISAVVFDTIFLWGIWTSYLSRPRCMRPFLVHREKTRQLNCTSPFGLTTGCIWNECCFTIIGLNFYLFLYNVYSFVPSGLSNDGCVETTLDDTNPTRPQIKDVWRANCPVLFVSVASSRRFFRRSANSLHVSSVSYLKSVLASRNFYGLQVSFLDKVFEWAWVSILFGGGGDELYPEYFLGFWLNNCVCALLVQYSYPGQLWRWSPLWSGCGWLLIGSAFSS